MRVITSRLGFGLLCLLFLRLAVVAQQPELVIQTGESQYVFSLAFSTDGKTLISGGGTYARHWDIESGKDLGSLSDVYRTIAVASNARADRIAISGRGGEIQILDGTTRQELFKLDSRSLAVTALAFDAEGKTLIGALVRRLEDSEVTVLAQINMWDLQTGRELKTLVEFKGLPLSVAISPDKKILAAVSLTKLGDGGQVETRIWNLDTGAVIKTLISHKETTDDGDDVYSVAFSPDGRSLAVGTEDGLVLLSLLDWSSRTLDEAHEVYAVAFSPNGKTLATGCSAEDVMLWDVASGTELWSSDEHDDNVLRVAFSPDGRTLASVSTDNVIKVSDVASGHVLRTFAHYAEGITTCFFNSESKTITSRSEDRAAYRVWDLTTGKKALKVGGARDTLFSDDNRWLIEGGWETKKGGWLKVWDLVEGNEIYSLSSPLLGYLSINRWQFSPDKKFFAVSKEDDTVILLNLESRKPITLNAPRSDNNIDARFAFSPDGKIIATANHSSIKLWQTSDGQFLKALASQIFPRISFSPDGKQIASMEMLGPIEVWNVSDASKQRSLGKELDDVLNFTFTPDGKRIVANNKDDSLAVWDVGTGKLLHTVRGDIEFFISPDSAKLATSSPDGTVRLLHLATGEEVRAFKTPPDRAEEISFIGGGRFFLVPREGGLMMMWDVLNNREETFGEAKIKAVMINRGLNLMAVEGEKLTRVYDASSGALLQTYGGESGSVFPVQFRPDGKVLIVADSKEFRVCDVVTGATLWTFPAAIGPTIAKLDFSDDGRFVLSGGEDGYLRLWDARDGRLVASLIELGESDWAVVTPDGRFDASPGAFDLMHWRIGREVVAFSQLKERFYEPGLLAKVTGFSKEPLRNITALKDVKLYPAASYEMAGKGSYKLKISLTNRGGGIGPVQVFVNGKEAIPDARDDKLRRNPQTQRATLTVDLKSSHSIPGQANRIRVYAWNYDEVTGKEYISSRGAELMWVPPGAAEKYDPEFYALIVGVSDYAGQALQLKYAAKDAEDIARAVSLAGERLFGAEKVHVKLLSTSRTQPADRPTKGNIRLAFEEFRRAKPGDVFFIYFAGHGVTLGQGSDSYLFLTQEARSTDSAVLADAKLRHEMSISGEELTAWINKVPALREAMVLDTCAAGAFGNEYKRKRTLSGDAIRAIEKLKDRTGFHILMGSASDAFSYEASQYGQGLLTYALLQGMKGAALAPSGEVDVQTIFQYAANHVPLLARDVGGIQKPEIKIPSGGVSFPFGLLTDEDRRSIPLAGVKPVIVRPVMVDKENSIDPLRLAKLFGDELRETSYVTAKGGATTLVYLDTEDMPDAFAPYGTYSVSGGHVQVTLKLVRNHEVVSTFTVEGSKDDLGGFTKKLVEAVTKSAQQLLK